MSRSLVLSVSLFLTLAAQAFAGSYTTYSAVEFARPDGVPLLMDLRVPDGPGLHPVIVYLHSGAWISGNRLGGPALRQASRGYAVASIDYRLAPDHIWPAQIEDCKAAVRWLRAHASEYQLDPERVGVFGASAGGHLAAVLGTSGGVPSLEGAALGNAGQSSRVRVVVDFYGPTDLLRIEEQKLPCIPLDGNAPFMPPSLLMGCPIQQCREWTATANPITYVTPDDPPFLILHGMLDCLVPWQQSQMLQDALEAVNVDSTLVLIPSGDHGGSIFDQPQYQQMVDDFLDTHLMGPVSRVRRRAVGH